MRETTPFDKLALDFGDDRNDEQGVDAPFDAWIENVAPSIHAPGPTPRAEMWEAIAGKVIPTQPVRPSIVDINRARWAWPTAIAAALLLGIGVDRLMLSRAAPSARPEPHVTASGLVPPNDPARLYKLAAVQTLSQAEALLTAYRASDAKTHDAVATRQLGTWGRQVLSSTRLLLDSPAGNDPQLRDLLDDLELVLVQIIRSSGTELNAGERALIDRAMKDRDLLPRIRTAVPAGASSAATE